MGTYHIPEMQEYQDFLERLANSNSDTIITNGGVSHASILLGTLFKYAQHDVKMFCGGLNGKLVNKEPYKTEFRNYLLRGGALQLLVQNDAAIRIEDGLFNFVRHQRDRRGDGSIEIKMISPNDQAELFKALNTNYCHFSVFDGTKLRYETDPDKYTAIGSFNYPEMANRLTKLFDNAFNKSQLVD